MSDAILEVTHLVKDYQLKNKTTFRAVDDISFHVSTGECLGLLGPNGAGKSSTMNCLTGFYRKSNGQVKILGVDVHENPKVARQKLGMCSQEDTLDTDFSVFNQMVRFATFFRIPLSEAKVIAADLLKRFELDDKKDQPVENLSGGMRRRLQVARAFVNTPQLVILDEPTTGLDPEVRRSLWELILEFKSKGTAILLSTHYMDEAQRLCDRVALMHKGKIVDCNTPEALIEKYVGTDLVNDEIRKGVVIKRVPNLEDVYLKVTGAKL